MKFTQKSCHITLKFYYLKKVNYDDSDGAVNAEGPKGG